MTLIPFSAPTDKIIQAFLLACERKAPGFRL